MKKVILLLMCLFMLTGCGSQEGDIAPARELRNKLQGANGCSFDAKITADYGEMIYTFILRCKTNSQSELLFELLEPESISGITGSISGDSGAITFDDKVLAFQTLADGYISPVSSPWVFVNALLGGYITSCGKTEDGYRISLNDTYAEDALQMDVWISMEGKPVHCDILYKERRCLTLEIKNFIFL